MSRVPSLMSITQRAFISTASPRSWPIILGAIAVSALVIVVMWALCSQLIGWLVEHIVSWEWLISFLQGAAAIGLVWALFPLLIPMFISFFVNKLAADIDAREYPDRPAGSNMPFWPEFAMDAKFALYALLLNLLALPAYLLIPGINLVIYYALNAHLLGKQYMMMVLRRHVPKSQLKEEMKRYRHRIYLCGFVIVLCSTIPLLNLLAPAIATALMVHAYHRHIEGVTVKVDTHLLNKHNS